MKKMEFIARHRKDAEKAGKTFGLNPVVILAQAALESGWGQSVLSKEHKNFFGLTAFGTPNDYWHGCGVTIGERSLQFRKYGEPLDSFLDYARLIRRRYPRAAEMTYTPEAFAKEIAYSPYISEVNGDDREAYRRTLCRLTRQIAELLSIHIL